jgi:two-component system, probable response regulator PhcQ
MTITRLVLVDDDPHVLAALRRLLQRGLASRALAIEAYTAPRVALERLRERPVDLVICDYRMPVLDGVSLLRQVARAHPGTARMLLTGSPDLAAVLRAVNDAGVSRVLLKPWDNQALLSEVRACLQARDEMQEQSRLAEQARRSGAGLSAQQLELSRIEALWPGITQVEWTADGAVQFGDTGLAPLDRPPHNRC